MHELFRRLVFNNLVDNTDDDEKNHVLLVTPTQYYSLAPAFDLLPMASSLGCQAMVVGERGAESSIENALTAAAQYWLRPADALAEAARVARVVARWREHFAAKGLSAAAIDEIARHIDRPFLMAAPGPRGRRGGLARVSLAVDKIASPMNKTFAYLKCA